MIETILTLANQSQGVALWVLVLLLTVAWLKVNHRIESIKEYIRLQFRFMEHKMKDHRDDLIKLKEEMRK